MAGFAGSLTQHVLSPVMIANDFRGKSLRNWDHNRLNVGETTALLESHCFFEHWVVGARCLSGTLRLSS